MASLLVATYVASESAPGSSWGSFTYRLVLNEDGSAQFYRQNVADRDTDSTYNHVGEWSAEDGVVDFRAGTKLGKQNYDSETVSSPTCWFCRETSKNVSHSQVGTDIFFVDRRKLRMNIIDSVFYPTTTWDR